MQAAHIYAELSTATRLKVGAIVVKDDRIISIGYNGTPAGWDNNCEDKEWMPADAGGWLDPDEVVAQWPYAATSDEDGSYIGRYRLKTKPEVIHAEANAIAKLAKSLESGLNSEMFLTHSPCIECAKQIYAAGVKAIYYKTEYKSTAGIEFLKKCGVAVEQIS